MICQIFFELLLLLPALTNLYVYGILTLDIMGN